MKILELYKLLIIILCLTACKKDPEIFPITSNEGLEIQNDDTMDFTCVTFPKWFHAPPDSVTKPSEQAMFWQYRPGMKAEVIYSLNSQISTCNFLTRQRFFITDYMQYLPDCNGKGWILFSDFRDQSIYKVKTNGDSLIRLTYEGLGGGHWDYSGNAIYYFSEPTNMLYKINPDGKKLDSILNVPAQFTGFSKKEDKLFYCKNLNGVSGIVSLDMTTRKEKVIKTNIYGGITVDDSEENLYISNSADGHIWSLLRVNIASSKLDTILKDCDNHIFTWPCISANTGNKITIGCIFAKFLDPKTDPSIKSPRVLRWTETFEADCNDPVFKLKKVNLFP